MAGMLVLAILLGAGIGAVAISPAQILAILAGKLGLDTGISFAPQQEAVFLAIRFPRVVFGLLIGAALGISGAALQGLFRNPLADPALIGVSSGATLAAVVVTVFGEKYFTAATQALGIYLLPVSSFLGAFAVTVLVYRLSQYGGKTLVSTLLLAGIAINALASALTGFTIFYASDAQLRSITFWTLGSLGGATWSSIYAILPFIGIALLVLPRTARALNIFALGETNAAHLGIRTERIKRSIIVLTALAVGASVAVSGIIGFVGLVVPHIVRMLIGPDNRYLLLSSAMMGAALMVIADIGARMLMNTAELPIGILTSMIGGPVFLYILLKERKNQKIL